MNDKTLSSNSPASPPCYQHEIEDASHHYLGEAAILTMLNNLIEGERAGARGLIDITPDRASGELINLMKQVAKDEARFCSMLSHHVERLQGIPSRATGIFYEKLLAQPTLLDQLQLLDRGQKAVVRMLEDAIPLIADITLRQDLTEMRDVHIVNIKRCAQAAISIPATP